MMGFLGIPSLGPSEGQAASHTLPEAGKPGDCQCACKRLNRGSYDIEPSWIIRDGPVNLWQNKDKDYLVLRLGSGFVSKAIALLFAVCIWACADLRVLRVYQCQPLER
jgi:hypothetical protein